MGIFNRQGGQTPDSGIYTEVKGCTVFSYMCPISDSEIYGEVTGWTELSYAIRLTRGFTRRLKVVLSYMCALSDSEIYGEVTGWTELHISYLTQGLRRGSTGCNELHLLHS